MSEQFAFTDPQSEKPAAGVVLRSHDIAQGHHDLVYYTWQMGPAVGPPLFTGRAVLVTEDDLIVRAYGFWDPAPDAAADVAIKNGFLRCLRYARVPSVDGERPTRSRTPSGFAEHWAGRPGPPAGCVTQGMPDACEAVGGPVSGTLAGR